MLWSCPRCGEKFESRITTCSRCGSHRGESPTAPAIEASPPKTCPACGSHVVEPTAEGQLHCGACGRDFPDYEDWVRQCRLAAYAGPRPIAAAPTGEPATRPRHLKTMAIGLIVLAPIFAGLAAFEHPLIFWPCTALALLQAVSGVLLLRERRIAGRFVRLAAGLSVLAPLPLSAPYVLFFEVFSRPNFTRYFGDRPDPASPRIKHLVMGWLAALSALLLYVLIFVIPGALETARRWNEPLSSVLGATAEVSGYVSAHAVQRCGEILMILVVLAFWARINRIGFLAVSSIALAALLLVGGPAIVAPLHLEYSAQKAADLEDVRHPATLLRALSDPDPKLRVAAARGLGTLGRGVAANAPALVHALEDPDRRVRLNAAVALSRIDPRTVEAIPVLKEEAARPEERTAATRALANFGPASRPALWILLENLAVDDESSLALAEIGLPVVPHVCEALGDRDAAVRRRAATTLRRLGGSARSCAPVLVDALKDPDPKVRAEVVAALAEIQGPKALPQLLPLLEDPGVCEAAGAALCSLGEREGLPPLKEGGAFLNALRRPALWDHLRKTLVDGEVEGTGRDILKQLATKAAMKLDLQAPGGVELSAFRRFHARGEKRSIIEILNALGVEFILESDQIRVLPTLEARQFWATWLSNERGG